MTDNERAQILKMVEDGKITPEQGLTLMRALEDDAREESLPEMTHSVQTQAVNLNDPAHLEFERRLERFRRLWLVPLVFGLVLVFAGGWWMFLARKAGLGLWFFVACIPFLLGVALVAVAYSSRTSRWIYIHIRQKPGESPGRIVLAFPLGWVAGLMHFAGQFVEERERFVMDEVLGALKHGESNNQPFFVDVNEAGGEHVQIYIG